MKQKLVIVIVIIIVVVGAVVYWIKHGSKKAAAPNNSGQTQMSSGGNQQPKSQPVAETNVDVSKLPERFPADIPLEAGASVTSNYNAVNAAGMFQSSREFVSAKTMDQNFSLYQSALKKSGWTITSAQADPAHNQDVITATKDGNNLNIRIYTKNNQVLVSINNETKP